MNNSLSVTVRFRTHFSPGVKVILVSSGSPQDTRHGETHGAEAGSGGGRPLPPTTQTTLRFEATFTTSRTLILT